MPVRLSAGVLSAKDSLSRRLVSAPLISPRAHLTFLFITFAHVPGVNRVPVHRPPFIFGILSPSFVVFCVRPIHLCSLAYLASRLCSGGLCELLSTVVSWLMIAGSKSRSCLWRLCLCAEVKPFLPVVVQDFTLLFISTCSYLFW